MRLPSRRKSVFASDNRPSDAGPVKVDEQGRHRVEEPVAVRPGSEREPHEQTAVLDRVGEVLGDEDGAIALRVLGKPGRGDGGQLRGLEAAQNVEFGPGHVARLFLEGERLAADHEEADKMARRPDRQVAECQVLVTPGRQWQVPGELEEPGAAVSQPKERECAGRGRLGQSFLRR